MSTSFPGALDALKNPAATDGLTGHAAQHANANDAIEALEAKVGVDNSTDPASLDYRVAAVESGKVDKVAGKQLSTEDYSTSEKQKLAGIAEGANAYTHPVSHAATMIIEDSAHRFITDTQAAAWDSKAAGAHVGSGGTAHAAVTTSSDGFISAADKVKLDAISGTNTGDETATTIKTKLGISTLSGVNTGDQTSVTGNAGTATKLQTARTINSVPFDGSANITINAVDSTARIASSEKGAANGVAPLGADLKIAAAYLPSYVDDVLEYANQAAFPASGETGKIYVALDSNKPFRWSGSAYVEISASPGSTDAVTEGSTNLYFTAQRVRDAVLTGLSTATNAVISATDTVLGALGKLQKQISDNLTTLTSHKGNTSNPHSVTKAQVGLNNVDNVADVDKPISTATQTALNAKANLSGALFTGAIGYGPGAGGTVTQATSKFTAVTLNKPCGMITTHNASLAAGGSAIITFNNTLITHIDTLLVSPSYSASNPSNYRVETIYTGGGQAGIRVTNLSGDALSDAIQINFTVIKGAIG